LLGTQQGVPMDAGIKDFRKLERKTLLEDWGAQPLRSFLRPSFLKEPAFGNLIVLCRLSGDQPASSSPWAWKRDNNRPWLRSYKDAPMSSIKMAFPTRELLVRPIDLLRLDLITVGGAVYLVYLYYISAASSLLLLPPLVVFIVRTILLWRNTSQRYDSEVSQLLLDSTEASGSNVLLQLANSAEQQLSKELCIAFFFAHQMRETGGIGLEEAQAFAEYFVRDEFAYDSKIELRSAFETLQSWGIVQQSGTLGGERFVTSSDLRQTVEFLRDRWKDWG